MDGGYYAGGHLPGSCSMHFGGRLDARMWPLPFASDDQMALSSFIPIYPIFLSIATLFFVHCYTGLLHRPREEIGYYDGRIALKAGPDVLVHPH
jgi:hypothetical protein